MNSFHFGTVRGTVTCERCIIFRAEPLSNQVILILLDFPVTRRRSSDDKDSGKKRKSNAAKPMNPKLNPFCLLSQPDDKNEVPIVFPQ